MISFNKINSKHIVQLGLSPNEGDIAFASIDSKGTIGMLNRFVLSELNYSSRNLPSQEELEANGFAIFNEEGLKPIVFIVTVNGRETEYNLEDNLFKALVQFRGLFIGKKLWIPLMGTGTGGLTEEESYIITTDVINRFLALFPSDIAFLVSIPNSPGGNKLINHILPPSSNELAETEQSEEHKVFGFKLTSEQADLLYKKEFSKNQFFNPVPDINGDYFIFGPEVENCDNPDFPWVKKLELSEYVRPIFNDENLYQPSTFKKEVIASLVSDSDKGIDYLDITKDVNAFARVIAAKNFEPPLAISLFGKWGSGKSFFMRKLKEKISTLSKNTADGTYCEGVVHIHFNAWSYMDSNLWASIVTKIFEELNEYISENSKGDSARKEIEELLINKLSIAKEEIGILEGKKKSVTQQIDSLNSQKDKITKELNEKIGKIKTDSLWKIIEEVDKKFDARAKIIKALDENKSYVKTKEDYKIIVPEKYWSDPEKTYQLAKSRITFLKEFFRIDKIWCNVIWLSIVLGIIVYTPDFLTFISFGISKVNFIIPQAILSLLFTTGAIWRRAELVYQKLQPLVASFWEIKESHEDKVKEAKAIFEQEEKAIKLEIEKGKLEVIVIQEQIQKAELIKTDLDFRISNAFATEVLYSFIDKRSKSDDYKKHLGLISIIRKDFEILNDLFVNHNQEADKIREVKEFRDKFKKPLERIILYIDDLDRCPEDNVVQVLEAVNLLMAFPLFVVIVGVDSRWVKNALIRKHAFQFTEKLKGTDSLSINTDVIEPSNYLEKIFQIPFHLRDAKDTSVKDMIEKLAQSKSMISDYTEKEYNEGEYISDYTNVVNGEQTPQNVNPTSINESDIVFVDKPETLILTTEEIFFMQEMSEVIGNNPRAIKRFVNIYRIIKAHEEFDYKTYSINQELLVVLFLIALSLGQYRKLLPSLELFIENEENRLKPLSFYLQPVHKVGELNELKHHLDVALSGKNSFGILQRTLVGVLKEYNVFIKRFTFEQI